jgi:hypothetical protein
MFGLHAQVSLLRGAFNAARFYYRAADESTRQSRQPWDKSAVVVHRDRLVNALANRCLSLVEAVVQLCRLDLDDDAYALDRVLFEATMHLECITSGDWRMRSDTYAHFIDAYQLKVRNEFFADEELSTLAEEVWAQKRQRVEALFVHGFPRTWTVFPADGLRDGLGKVIKKSRPDVRQLDVRSEYEFTHPRLPEDPLPFWVSWIYKHGSSYVHSDVASLDTTSRDLGGNAHFALRVPPGGSATRPHALPVAVALHLSVCGAIFRFAGHEDPELAVCSEVFRELMQNGG